MARSISYGKVNPFEKGLQEPLKPYLGYTAWPEGRVAFDKGLLNMFTDYFSRAWDKSGQIPFNTNAGLGLYDSALLGKLTDRITSDLTNPNASIEMGLARDRITGSGNAARQGLSGTMAGYGAGTRLSGPGMAMQGQLDRDIMKSESDAYRTIASDVARRVIADAMGLESMKGGFYESSKGRELANAGLNKDWGLSQNANLANLMGILGSNLLGFGGADVGAQQQTFNNLLGMAQGKNAEAKSNWDTTQKYNQDLMNYYDMLRQLGGSGGRTMPNTYRGGGYPGGGGRRWSW